MIFKGEYNIVDTDRNPYHIFPPGGRCHDCGRQCNEYRCSSCAAAFNATHFNYSTDCMVDGDLQSLHDIFQHINRDRLFKGLRR